VGKRSRLEIHVGQELKDEYGLGYHERLCLEVRGKPNGTANRVVWNLNTTK